MTGKETIDLGFLLQGHFKVLDAFGSFTHLTFVLYMQRGPHSNQFITFVFFAHNVSLIHDVYTHEI